MGYHLLNVLILLYATCGKNVSEGRTIKDEEKSSIEYGLVAGQNLGEVLSDGNFRESLKKIGTKLGPFLKVLGPLASILLAFISTGDSAELVFMREKFEEVNNKLDIITSQFKDVRDAIDWATVTISYSDFELEIVSQEENVNRIYRFQGDTRQTLIDRFILGYNSNFADSDQKLYNVIMKNDNSFALNVLVAAMKKTKNHKRKFEEFSLGLVQLLIRGVKVRISHYGMNGDDASHVVEEWVTKINDLKVRLQTISDTIKDSYLTQLRTDAQDIILRHHGLGNEGLMNKIYDFVKEKYDWRSWFVAVYDDMSGWDNHNMWQNGGTCFLHEHKKNIIIASQEKNVRFNVRAASQILTKTVNFIFESEDIICALPDRAYHLVETMRDTARSFENKVTPRVYLAIHDSRAGNNLVYRSENSHTVHRRVVKLQSCEPFGRLVLWSYDIVMFV